MQRATDILEREHRTIEKILRVIGVLADELAEDRDIDSDVLPDICQFLRIVRTPMSSWQGRELSFSNA